MPETQDVKRLLRFGAFEANLNAGELRKHGVKIKLQDQPFKILTLLLLQAGEVVAREDIHKNLWGDGTFVDFERGLNKAVNRLREALGDSAENPRYIETLPKRGYRFIAPIELAPVDHQLPLLHEQPPQQMDESGSDSAELKSRFQSRLLISALLLLLTGAAATIFYMRGPALPTERDTVVLADFVNRTGDSVFDDTLKQALSIDLQQSPFLKILSEQQLTDTLRLMLRNPDERITGDLARSVCRRTGSKAVVAGSIASIGSEFVIWVDATNCANGQLLAQEQVRAARHEQVLSGIDVIANGLRRKLGESLPSIQKYNKPIHEALSTGSLDAFEAYANGERIVQREGSPAVIPFFRRAVELDPSFAYAYGALGLVYGVWGEATLASENTKKAYELREHVTEWEKFFVSVQYHFRVTTDVEKALELARIWTQTYPQERTAHNRLAAAYALLGNHEKAATELENALSFGGKNPIDITDLSRVYMSLGRLMETGAILREAIGRNPQRVPFRRQMYVLAFLQNDDKLMAQQVDWANGEPGALALLGHYDTEAYLGRLAKARELTKMAIESALRNGFSERVALLQATEALRETEFGNRGVGREHALNALSRAPGPEAQVLAALALAQTDVAGARETSDRLNKLYPSATLIQNYWLPSISAEIEIASHNPSRAIELLRKAESYELSSESAMIPVYVRAKAYLSAKQGQAAAIEFQNILKHRGIIGNNPIGALAQLGLARALTVSGNIAEARIHYQRLLAIWKDADPNLPVLKEARAEFARLASSAQQQ